MEDVSWMFHWYIARACVSPARSDHWMQQSLQALSDPFYCCRTSLKWQKTRKIQELNLTQATPACTQMHSRVGSIPVTPRTTTPSRRRSHLRHTQNNTHTLKGSLHTFHIHPKPSRSHVCDTPDILVCDNTRPHSRPGHRKKTATIRFIYTLI